MLSALAIGCTKKDDDKPGLVLPATYDSTTFETAAAAELAVADQLTALTNEAKKGRVPGAVVSASALEALYINGAPALATVATAYYDGRLRGPAGYFTQLAAASGGTYAPGAPAAGATGGTFGGYLFDGNGLEPEQLIEKGLFGAALYHHTSALLNGPLTAATPHRVMAALGVSPAFPSSGNATKHARPDRLVANYIARRDRNDGAGFYSSLKNDLIKLQAAIKAGDAYQSEQQQAVTGIRLAVEKTTAATVIHYCHTVMATLSRTNLTEAQQAAALHAYGECVGFVQGWRNLPASEKRITDAQVDEVLALLNVPATGAPTSYRFITESATERPKLQQVISRLQTIYGFSATQIEEFRRNWVADQDR